MMLKNVVELMEKHADCPKCGNDCVGPGAGSIQVYDNTFKRKCNCGWEVIEHAD
jgi:hypothetical protein